MHTIELNKYNWEEIQNYYNQCCNKTMVMKKFNLSRHCLYLARKANLFKCLVIKHSWQRKDKKYSQPCEIFKKFLIQNEIHFYQQYSDRETWKRNYSIDIAFPNQKIGIQINGNMHYTTDGQLKPYYQQRQNLLQSFGWKIYQIPYLEVWNEQLRQKILNMIKKNINFEYDYTQQIKQNMQKKRLQHICSICGGYKKTRESKYCDWCNKHYKPIQKSRVVKKILGKKLQKSLDRQNIQKILKQELWKLVKQHSLEQTGRLCGVSGNSIKKICIKYGIDYKQYSHSIRSRIVKNVMKQQYKNYQNPKGVCPICKNKKHYSSVICRKCYLKNRKLVDKFKNL